MYSLTLGESDMGMKDKGELRETSLSLFCKSFGNNDLYDLSGMEGIDDGLNVNETSRGPRRPSQTR